MPLTWSRGCSIGAIGARHTFVALIPYKPSQSRYGSPDNGKSNSRLSEAESRGGLKYDSHERRFVKSPHKPELTETRTQRLPGWAGGQSFYAPSLKVYGPVLMQSPYLSSVKVILPVKSSGLIGEFPRSRNQSPCLSPPRSPQSRAQKQK